MQKITPFVWFDNNAEEAMNLYVSLFEDAEILNITRYPEGAPGFDGSLMTGSMRLAGQEIMVLNGGPHFKLTEAFSLMIDCENQEEVDYFWDKLSEGGETSQCGWLKDKFGLSWQVIPKQLGELMGDPDPEKAGRVMQAMLQMTKIEIDKLQAAYDQQ